MDFRVFQTLCMVGAFIIGGISHAPSHAQTSGFSGPPNFSQMVEARLPAVLGIVATGAQPSRQDLAPELPPGFEDFFGLPRPDRNPQNPSQALGSGFIISEDGFVVTNAHVIEGARKVEVILEDERTLEALVVGSDPATDIALLKLEGVSDMPHVAWGPSRDVAIGEWVVAIGNPFGLGSTVTAGIVSGQSRNINAGPYDDFIQTDAAINSGNSGGPLFNARGQVIGVNTAIFSPSGGNVGIGFAVPSHVAQRVVEDLKDDGQVDRGWLGVQVQGLTENIATAIGLPDTRGALINQVVSGGPADAAMLQVGDVILAANDTDIADPRDLVFAIADLATDEEAMLTIWRDGAREEVTVTIGRMPSNALTQAAETPLPAEDDDPRLGTTLSPLSADLRAQLQVPGDVDGLVITQVTEDSAADRAGLVQGDVIIEAGGQPATNAEVARDALEAAQENDRPLLLRIFRNGNFMFVAVNLTEN